MKEGRKEIPDLPEVNMTMAAPATVAETVATVLADSLLQWRPSQRTQLTAVPSQPNTELMQHK